MLNAPILFPPPPPPPPPPPDRAMGGCPPAPPVGWCGEAGTLPSARMAKATGPLEMGERGRYSDGCKVRIKTMYRYDV